MQYALYLSIRSQQIRHWLTNYTQVHYLGMLDAFIVQVLDSGIGKRISGYSSIPTFASLLASQAVYERDLISMKNGEPVSSSIDQIGRFAH